MISQVNMASVEGAFILPLREKQSSRKEIDALKKRVNTLEQEVTELKNVLTMLVTEKEQPSFLSKVFGLFTFWKQCKPEIVEAPVETINERPEDLMGERPVFTEPVVLPTIGEWTDTGTNVIPCDIFEDKLKLAMNQRAKEDEEIKNSLQSKEEAEAAFKKFNEERDEEALKVYSDYIEKRGF